jgi:hypothetical protein
VDAIQRIEQDPELQRALIENGTRRLAMFGGSEEMAARYWEVFNEAANESCDSPPVLSGVFDDGWVGEQATILFGNSASSRELVLNLAVPAWSPLRLVSVRVAVNGERLEVYTIRRGETAAVRRTLPARRGFVQLLCSPAFRPNACGMGDDSRALSCQCHSAEIVSGHGTIVPLTGQTYAT